MGGSQSTSSTRAAKFSGNGANRRSVRAVRSAPATDPTHRRATSVRNTNRNVKEFSKFWSDAGSVSRSKSSSRQSTKRSTSSNNNNGSSVRRNRTQSVDVRRTSQSQCLSVPSGSTTANTKQRDRSPNQKRATSFRLPPSPVAKAKNEKSGVEQQQQQQQPTTTRSDIYSPDFNDALIAAARLRRLSLIPPSEQPPSYSSSSSHQPHQYSHHSPNRPLTFTTSSPYASYHQNIHQNPTNEQKSPETAIY